MKYTGYTTPFAGVITGPQERCASKLAGLQLLCTYCKLQSLKGFRINKSVFNLARLIARHFISLRNDTPRNANRKSYAIYRTVLYFQ